MFEESQEQPIRIAHADTPEWHASRRTGIGASQAGAACGVSPYSSPLEVYQQVRGEIDFQETKFTRFGKIIEPAIVELFRQECEEFRVQYPAPMYRSGNHDFMLATPDGILWVDQDSLDRAEGLEVKSTGWQLWKQVQEQGLAEVFPHYLCQCQHQMSVMNWPRVQLAFLVERTLHVLPVDRDDEAIGMIVTAEADLWQKIQNGEPPSASKPSDLSLLLRNTQIDEQPLIGLTQEATDRWIEYERIGVQIRELKSQQDVYKSQVVQEIGSRPGGLLSTGDRFIRRKMVERKGYTVEPKEYLDVRAVKYKDEPIERLSLSSP